MAFRRKSWIVPPVDSALTERLAKELTCSRVFATLLIRRGVLEREEAARFLGASLKDLSDPSILPDLDRAVERISQALRARERIMIFGDYDVDGVSSTSLLLDFFRLIDYPVSYRLPHRIREGYGLRLAIVEEFAAQGVQLLICVDNGSSSTREIARARELGIDAIVVDHHEPGAELPPAYAHVNPLLDSSGRVFSRFAAVGLVFKLVWGLTRRLSLGKKSSPEFRQFLFDSLALVALGTVADVVPLRGENRAFVKHGLGRLEASPRPGLRKLLAAAAGRTAPSAAGPGRSLTRPPGNGAATLDSKSIGFRVSPRLNAAGRLGSADLAIQVLQSACARQADELVEALDRENSRRRQLDAKIYDEARSRVLAEVDLASARAIVLGDREWHLGVLGIVAARLTEEFFRPTLLVAEEGGRCRGSARSIPSVHITQALSRCKSCLRSFGGHAMAAGFEIDADKLADLRRSIQLAIETPIAVMVPEIEADCRVRLADVTAELLDEMAKLAPHGEGNPEPLFLVRDLEIVGEPRAIGDRGQHLSFHVREDERAFRAVAFGQGNLQQELCASRSRVSLLFHPVWNTWQGRRSIELNVREIELQD